MRDYGKVSPQFWIGETGKKLRKAGAEAQVVSLYLMTCPHSNMIGMFYMPLMYIAHETGLGLEGASKGLARASEAGFCMYDEGSEVVWVLEMARFQIGDSMSAGDKRCKGVQNEYDSVPANPYLALFYGRYSSVFHMTKNRAEPTKQASPLEAPSEALGSQEQEQEQEQEKTYSPEPVLPGVADSEPAEPAKRTRPPCPHQQIIDLYHQILPMGTQVRVWNDARTKSLQARWREDPKRQSLGWWEKFFTYIAESEFLTGQTPAASGRDPFVVSLDWLINPQNFAKSVEGKYHRSAA